MTSKRFIFAALACVLGSALGSVLGPTAAHGQGAGVFSRLGFGARGLAMSNALVADVSGDVSPYYNPALAPFATGQSLEATAAFLSLDRELQFLQFATPLRPRAGVAAGLIHAGVSGIDGRDGSGYHTEELSTDEFAFFLAFGTRMGERLTGGIALQLFRADYYEGLAPVNSIGIDLGLTARVTDALSLGLTVDDLLARYSWDTAAIYGEGGNRTSDRFPARLRFGGAYELMGGRARVVAEYESRITSAEVRTRSVASSGGAPLETRPSEQLRLHDSRLRVGAEYRPADVFALRAGLDRIGDDGVAAATPSAGFMVEQPVGTLTLRAEYAFMLEPYAVGSMHFVTLRVFL